MDNTVATYAFVTTTKSTGPRAAQQMARVIDDLDFRIPYQVDIVEIEKMLP